MLGDEIVHARRCWKLHLRPPNRDSQYSNVFLWSDKESGALFRLEGYDWNGQLIKRFEVVSGQTIDDRWFLKQMRVEEFQPGTAKMQSRTYLESKVKLRLPRGIPSMSGHQAIKSWKKFRAGSAPRAIHERLCRDSWAQGAGDDKGDNDQK